MKSHAAVLEGYSFLCSCGTHHIRKPVYCAVCSIVLDENAYAKMLVEKERQEELRKKRGATHGAA